jgi:hypothetical protein
VPYQETPVTISLHPWLVQRLDIARGDKPASEWVYELVTRALDRLVPASGETPTQGLRRLAEFRNFRWYVLPLRRGEYPTVDELAPLIPVPFPPKLADERHGHGPGRTGDREFQERCIWMIAMDNSGWPWEDIAETMGYKTAHAAKTAVSVYMRRVGEQQPEEQRSVLRAKFDLLEEMSWERLRNPALLYSVKGMAIKDPRDGSWAVDESNWWKGVSELTKLWRARMALDGSSRSDAAKINSDTADYELKISELLKLAQVRDPDAIEGEVVSDTDDLVDDQGQDPEQQPGSDEGSPAGPRLNEPGDDRRDEETQDSEDLQEPVDPGDGD